ncbi:hypothetical protein [Nocardioides yefusunii]|uniref:Uncharacterized protein n=1 Tax=Nocardioides yefusunii TaxID=2500546 RepID=A0ABW1QWW3_9ACTN|nr:hypothetical protein [Nocardioides yefusunii]
MSIVDLASTQHEWLEATVAGAETSVRMYPLHVDLQRGTRTVLVEYPAGWSRPGAGTQPAGEELVPVSGAFAMSSERVVPGQVMVTTPRALRSATSAEDVTRAVVFYTGPGGGWEDGDAQTSGSVSVVEIGAAGEEARVVREAVDGLVGHLELRSGLPEDGLEDDAEIIWLDAQRYAFVPRGGIPPEVEGPVLLRILPRS